MKAATSLCLLPVVGALAAAPISAQTNNVHTRGSSQQALVAGGSQTVTLHNPYTGGTVSVDLVLPTQPRPLAAVALLAGSNAREQQAAGALRRALAQRGYAVLTPPAVPPSGGTEDDNLNIIAALHYLQTRPELRGAPVGLIGYGEGVRLAAVSAGEANPASFLILLGGAVVPDRLNTLPESLARGALPKDEAVRALAHVNCPVLILMGEYDGQGTHRTVAENNEALRGVLDAAHHQNYTIKVLPDTDALLADTGAGGASQSSTRTPPASVWRAVTEWMGKEVRSIDPTGASDYTESGQRKPTRLYPKSVYGPFNFRPSYSWETAVGGQPRPFGLWYW